MWKTTIALVMLAALMACGNSHEKTRAYCDRVRTLCGDKARCGSDAELADVRKKLGKEVVDRYLACIDGADSCTEATSCAIGLLGSALDETTEGAKKGPGIGDPPDASVRAVEPTAPPDRDALDREAADQATLKAVYQERMQQLDAEMLVMLEQLEQLAKQGGADLDRKRMELEEQIAAHHKELDDLERELAGKLSPP